MQKNKVSLEIDVDENRHVYTCPSNATLGEIYDVLHKMKSHVVELIKKIEEQKKDENKEPQEGE